MKRNKRVIASAALSVSLATSGVAPVAWADEMHVKCPQFRGGSDFDGDVNAKVEEHLQRNCELITDKISRFSIRDEEFGETTEAGTGGEQQSEPLKVNTVKARDRQVTGSAFLRPGQKKTVQVIFPNALAPTQDLQLDQLSAESDDTSRGEYVPFEIRVPDSVALKAGDRIFFSLRDYSRDPGAGNVKSIEVTVQPADKGAESQPEQNPDGDNNQTPGGGAGDRQGKPEDPGAGDNSGTGKGSLSFGSIFGVIAGLGGVIALVMSVVKFFNQNSDVARFLQPLRNFFSLFKF